MDADARVASEIVVFGTAPGNLFGAAKAHREYLAVLRELGARTYQVSTGPSFIAGGLHREGVICLTSPQIRADAYPTSDVIEAFAVAERMAAVAQSFHASGSRVLLIGTYLYPFCLAVAHAAALLHDRGVCPAAVLVPAGSDIWQVGYQLPGTTDLLLSSPSVSTRVTYSRRFADEINAMIGKRLPFWIIPPPIDVKRFRPCDASQKQVCRREIGLDEQDFVLINCSNMRPVKELGLTLTIATAVAEMTRRPVVLLLVGPVTEHLVDRLRMWSGVIVGSDAPQEVRCGSLRVRLVGLQRDPRPYFWSADLTVNTSLHDSFNISLAESMACGVPVLSTDVVGIAEVPGVTDAGLFFPVDGDGLGPLRAKGHGFAVSIDRSLSMITGWVESTLAQEGAASERASAARAVVERELARGVLRGHWSKLLGGLQ